MLPDPQSQINASDIAVLQNQVAGQFIQAPDGNTIVYPGGGGSSLDLSSFPFTPTLSGLNLSVASGDIRRGIRAAVTASTGITPLVLPDDADAYIYVNVVLSDMTCTIAQSATKPVSDATNYKCCLYKYVVASGVATLSKIYHLGDIELSGVTG